MRTYVDFRAPIAISLPRSGATATAHRPHLAIAATRDGWLGAPALTLRVPAHASLALRVAQLPAVMPCTGCGAYQPRTYPYP
eukprot:3695557-Pyramimonas_sp.AAC.1